MSSIWLIRHGQGGTRHDYDTLSPLGRTQARRTGEYLAGQKIAFRAACSGSLRRQRETAAEVAKAYAAAGLEFPELTVCPKWNEFDLDTVYREMAPALAAEDPEFRRDYADFMRLAADDAHAIQHTWSHCDAAIVRAWIEGRFPCSAGSWEQFVARVRGCRDALPEFGQGESVAIFTSAVPVAIWVAMSLGVANGRILRIAGVMYNTALTTFRVRDGDLALFSFNGVPHLPEPELRTFR